MNCRRMLVRSIAWLASAALTGLLSPAAFAQSDWPRGPVKLVVPYGPGSTPDLVARIVGERLSAKLGKPFVIENKVGAAGNLGTDQVAKAAPDGQTIGISIAGPLGVNGLLFKKMPYDPARDLDPVTIAATQPSVLVVANKLGVASTAELLALMKKNPAKYSYSSMGIGTISHLAMQAMSASTSTDLVHVPYAGSGPAVAAVLAGDADMAVLPAAAVLPHIKAGKLTGLAVTTAKRSSSLPDMPTLAEGGVTDVQADAWMGFIVPAKTPPAIVKRLHDEIGLVLAEPEVREKLRLQYMDVVANTPDEFRAVLQADLLRWRPVIQKNNIPLD